MMRKTQRSAVPSKGGISVVYQCPGGLAGRAERSAFSAVDAH